MPVGFVNGRTEIRVHLQFLKRNEIAWLGRMALLRTAVRSWSTRARPRSRPISCRAPASGAYISSRYGRRHSHNRQHEQLASVRTSLL
jgi:hypothetical protein